MEHSVGNFKYHFTQHSTQVSASRFSATFYIQYSVLALLSSFICLLLFCTWKLLRCATFLSYSQIVDGMFLVFHSGTPWQVVHQVTNRRRRRQTSHVVFHRIRWWTVWRHRMISELITRRMAMNESSWVTVKVSKRLATSRGRSVLYTRVALMQIVRLPCLLTMCHFFTFLGRTLLSLMRCTVVLNLKRAMRLMWIWLQKKT